MTEAKNIYYLFPKPNRNRIGSLEIGDEKIELMLTPPRSVGGNKRQLSGTLDRSSSNFKSNYNLKYAIDSREIEIETLDVTEINGSYYIVLLSFNKESNTYFISLASALTFEILFYKEKSRKIQNVCAKGDILIVKYIGRVVRGIISLQNQSRRLQFHIGVLDQSLGHQRIDLHGLLYSEG